MRSLAYVALRTCPPMTDHGWLSFGAPRVVKLHAKPSGFAGVTAPTHGAQKAIIGPQFGELRKAIQEQRVQIASAAGESDPELIVVFVLAQPVADFRRAAEAAGIEYLAQVEDDELPLDSGFSTRDGKPVIGYAHGIVTNSKAADELIRCFNAWQKDRKAKLAHGLAPLKEVFETLHAIRRWDASDRVRETGLLDHWRDSIAVAAGSSSPRLVELELWYRTSDAARAAAQASVAAAVRAGGGTVLAHAQISEIRYHGILAEISAGEVEAALQAGAGQIRALTVDDVMFGSSAEGMTSTDLGDAIDSAEPVPTVPNSLDPPRIALLDGLPYQNHALLQGRLIVDDPEQVAGDYPEASRRHGTAMASLLIFGDLAVNGSPLEELLYCRPILRKHPWLDQEVTPRDQLLVDAVHRAIVEMLDGDRPAAPSVRIINLSIGCPDRVFIRTMSPMARLLDWLSFHYNTLIVVSAGNHSVELELDGYATALDTATVQKAAFAAIQTNSRAMGLLSPAESVNALTVGASHADASSPPANDALVELSPAGAPSAFSAQGFGFDRSTKPDLIVQGGRQFYRRPPPGSSTVSPARPGPAGPGHRVAAPDPLNSGRHGFLAGTSNAAALTSRLAAGIMRDLDRSSPQLIDSQYHPLVTRALIAHGAQWEPGFSTINQLATLSRKQAAKFLGYGVLSQQEITEVDPHRAVVLGAGTISDGDRHEFDLPIPSSLHSLREWKRLKITLAWFTAPGSSASCYVEARLTIAPPTKKWSWGSRVGVVDDQTVGGTLIQQVVEGDKAIVASLGDAWTIPVEARSATNRRMNPVRYAIVVSVEVSSRVLVDIREEIRGLLTQAAIQTQARIRS